MPDTDFGPAPSLHISCSFCLRAARDTDKIIEGPGTYICDRCVAACTAILDAAPSEGATSGPDLPSWSELDDDQLLARLPRIAAAGDQVHQALRAWVGEARRRSLSWTKIGVHLGISRQSAWERFAS